MKKGVIVAIIVAIVVVGLVWGNMTGKLTFVNRPTYICEDSDNTAIPTKNVLNDNSDEIKGSVRYSYDGKNFGTKTDECEKGESPITITEYYCDQDNKMQSVMAYCESGLCEDGACVPA